MIKNEIRTSLQQTLLQEEIKFKYEEAQRKGKKYFEFEMMEWLLKTQTQGLESWESFEQEPKDILEIIKFFLNETYKEQNQEELGIIFKNIPRTPNFQTEINQISIQEHEGKGKIIQGTIKRKSQNHAYISEVTRQCLSCNFEFNKTYSEDSTPKSITSCYKCKSRTRITKEKTTNISYLDIEELESNEYGRRDVISCVLKKDLARPELLKNIELGKEVLIVGKVKKRLISKKNMYIKIMAVYGIELLEETDNHEIKKQEIKTLKKISEKQDLVKWWTKEKKLYNAIEGHQIIKEAIIVALIGAKTTKNNGKINRGISHIFLCGDAGSSKSTFLKLTEAYALKSKYLTGAGATGVGLTGTVTRDELTGWTAEAGAMPLMNKGVVLADEIDKLPEDDENKLHEALEQMTVTLNKADISITLPAETTLISAGNPKKGNIDSYDKDIFGQMGFKQTTISRMDLIFITRDTPNPELDKLIGEKMIDNWEKIENPEQNKENITFFKKYQKYAKTLTVSIPDSLRKEMLSWYVDIRRQIMKAETRMQISSRALDGIIRLTKAHARANLRIEADPSDLNWAKETYFESLKGIATDFITGEIDMGKLETGIGTTERKIIDLVYDLIKNEEIIEYHEIKKRLNKDINDRELEKILEQLKRKGDIFEPKNGKYKIN